MSEKVLIIGGTSGIGEAMVRQLAQEGALIAVFGRNRTALVGLHADYPRQVFTFELDVLNPFDAEALLDQAAQALGGLDTFIYCSGVLHRVEPGQFDWAKDNESIRTNLLAAIQWLDAVGARFVSVGHGSMVVIGSVAGDRIRKVSPGYGASKAGLHAYAEGLRFALWDKGVVVSTIKPGPVSTPMTANLPIPMKISAEDAATRILKFRHKPGNHYLFFSHRVIFGIMRLLPEFIMKRLSV